MFIIDVLMISNSKKEFPTILSQSKYNLNLHTKKCKLGIAYVAFFVPLVLIILNKLVPNSKIQIVPNITNFLHLYIPMQKSGANKVKE